MTELDDEDMMTREELQAASDAIAAWERGDDSAAHEHLKKVRMLPGSLRAIKDTYGADAVREGGYNTELADKHYGTGWLDR